jgi:tetratricopeptide (TPR) repeat protein
MFNILKNGRLYVTLNLSVFYKYLRSDRYYQAEEIIDQITFKDPLIIDLLNIILAITKHNHQKAKDQLDTLTLKYKLMLPITKVVFHILQSNLLYLEKQYNLSLKQMLKAENIIEKINSEELNDEELFLFNEYNPAIHELKGKIALMEGDYQAALYHSECAIAIAKNITSESYQANLINNQAKAYFYLGKPQKSLELHLEIEKIRKKLDEKYGLAYAYVNIIQILQFLGEMDRAGDYLGLFQNVISHKEYSAMAPPSLIFAGYLLQLMNELDSAEQLFKINLENYKKLNDINEITGTHFYLFNLFLETKKIDQAKFHLDKLQKYSKVEDIDIQTMLSMAKAMQFRHNSRYSTKFQAIPLLQPLIIDERIKPEFRSMAMIQLAELYLEELELSRLAETEEELLETLNHIRQFANNRDYTILRINHLILTAKHQIVIGNPVQAISILANALDFAQNRNFKLLAMKISVIYDQLQDLLESNEGFLDSGKVKEQLLDTVNLPKNVAIESETPVLFLIINEGGFAIFQNHFSKQIIHADLVGSFLSAIYSFGQEIFNQQTSMEQIKYKDYTILIRSMNKVILTYIIRGPTYFARQKLSRISEKLQNQSEIMDKMNFVTRLKPEIQKELQNIIETEIKLDS